MSNKWKQIWDNRNESEKYDTVLSKLIAADGFDTGYGTITEKDWNDYIFYIANKLNITESDTIFEVGCGAGAFLFNFYKNGNIVGGIDYSNNLIKIANQYLPNGKFSVSEALNLDVEEKFDFVISNSVFFYFPSYIYAKKVLVSMIEKSKYCIAILEVNDSNKKEESMKLRKGYLTEEEYKDRYDGLEHLYYEKDWFIDIATEYGLKIEIVQQNINNYKNNMYRYNVFLYKEQND